MQQHTNIQIQLNRLQQQIAGTVKENSFLSVVIQKTVKLHMQYNEAKKLYIGSMSGMEFVTQGPEKFVTKHGR